MGTIFKIDKNLFHLIAFLFIGSCSKDQINFGEKVTLDCVFQNAFGTIPGNLYDVGFITKTDEYPPLNKKFSVCGISLTTLKKEPDFAYSK